jgi:hypothetical protein
MFRVCSCALAAAAAVALISVPAAGQSGAKTSAIPRLHDGKPDLNGVWQRPYVPDMTKSAKDQEGMAELPFTPLGAQRYKDYDPAKFDYTGNCLPQGLTRSMNSPFPIQIVQTPRVFAVLYEAWNVFHIAPIGDRGAIPVDARGFPKDMDPTWMGTSIARWDGDTLAVETDGFNGKTNLDTIGHPHSDQMHVTERYTRTDATHIRYEVIINDPVMYTRPWKNVRTFTLRPDWEIMEYSCMENNKDLLEGHIK